MVKTRHVLLRGGARLSLTLGALAICAVLACYPVICKNSIVRHYRFVMKDRELHTVVRAQAHAPSPVTIISSWFDAPTDGMTRFLQTVEHPIILFTSPELVEAVETARGDRPLHIVLPAPRLGRRRRKHNQVIIDSTATPDSAAHRWHRWLGPSTVRCEDLTHADGIQQATEIDPWHSRWFVTIDARVYEDDSVADNLSQLDLRLNNTLIDETAVLVHLSRPWSAQSSLQTSFLGGSKQAIAVLTDQAASSMCV